MLWSFGNTNNIQFSKCGAAVVRAGNTRSYQQVQRYFNHQVRINCSLRPYLAGLIEGIGMHPYSKLNRQVRNSSLLPLSFKSLDAEKFL